MGSRKEMLIFKRYLCCCLMLFAIHFRPYSVLTLQAVYIKLTDRNRSMLSVQSNNTKPDTKEFLILSAFYTEWIIVSQRNSAGLQYLINTKKECSACAISTRTSSSHRILFCFCKHFKGSTAEWLMEMLFALR